MACPAAHTCFLCSQPPWAGLGWPALTQGSPRSPP
jgi:hypothetical protein